MSLIRIDYVLNGNDKSLTIPVDGLHSEIDVLRRHRAQILQLVVGVSIPEHVLMTVRSAARASRLNLTLSPLGV